jgi:membrane protein
VAIAVPTRGRAELRRIATKVVRGVSDHDILTFGSAIAFQVVSSLAPLLLFGLALVGFVGLQETWSQHVEPWVVSHTSAEVQNVIIQAANKVLSTKRGFWLTGGAVLTLWEASGAVRAVMSAFDRIYGVQRERSRLRRYLMSFALAIACGACLLAAVLWGFAWSGLGGGWLAGIGTVLLRWPIVLALFAAAVGLLVHFAPAAREPLPWVSLGTALVVVAWLGTTVVFVLYASHIANYGSVFGPLAVFFVTCAYLYVAACAFLIGAEVDAVLRQESTGRRAGR